MISSRGSFRLIKSSSGLIPTTCDNPMALSPTLDAFSPRSSCDLTSSTLSFVSATLPSLPSSFSFVLCRYLASVPPKPLPEIVVLSLLPFLFAKRISDFILLAFFLCRLLIKTKQTYEANADHDSLFFTIPCFT